MLRVNVNVVAALIVFGLSGGAVLAQTSGAKPSHARATGPAAHRAPHAEAETAGVESKDKFVVSQGGGEVVARGGGTELTEAKIRAIVASLNPNDRAAIAKDPSLLSQMVRLLLANELVLKEALAKHWEQKPDVAEQIERARQATIVESYMQSVSAVPSSFPDEATIQDLYERNKLAFLVPRQFQIAQIFVALPAAADKATEEKAHKKLTELQEKLKQAGADFSAIAKADSDATDAKDNGGALGWVLETQLRPEIKSYVMGLNKGGISEPIKLDDGWHIVKLIDTKPTATRTLAEVKDQLVQRLRADKATALRRAYLAELLKQSPPVINELALSKLAGGSTP